MKLYPAVGWPLFIVGLLVLGIGGTFVGFWASRSDGGAQVVDNYYREAVRWDQTSRERTALAALGWSMVVKVQDSSVQPGLRALVVTITDSTGAPVTDVVGTIQVTRPHLADAVARVPFAPDSAGTYVAQVPMTQKGLWDFEVLARRDSIAFRHRVRIAL